MPVANVETWDRSRKFVMGMQQGIRTAAADRKPGLMDAKRGQCWCMDKEGLFPATFKGADQRFP
jgi:hypothetical protein